MRGIPGTPPAIIHAGVRLELVTQAGPVPIRPLQALAVPDGEWTLPVLAPA